MSITDDSGTQKYLKQGNRFTGVAPSTLIQGQKIEISICRKVGQKTWYLNSCQIVGTGVNPTGEVTPPQTQSATAPEQINDVVELRHGEPVTIEQAKEYAKQDADRVRQAKLNAEACDKQRREDIARSVYFNNLALFLSKQGLVDDDTIIKFNRSLEFGYRDWVAGEDDVEPLVSIQAQTLNDGMEF